MNSKKSIFERIKRNCLKSLGWSRVNFFLHESQQDQKFYALMLDLQDLQVERVGRNGNLKIQNRGVNQILNKRF